MCALIIKLVQYGLIHLCVLSHTICGSHLNNVTWFRWKRCCCFNSVYMVDLQFVGGNHVLELKVSVLCCPYHPGLTLRCPLVEPKCEGRRRSNSTWDAHKFACLFTVTVCLSSGFARFVVHILMPWPAYTCWAQSPSRPMHSAESQQKQVDISKLLLSEHYAN